MVTHQHPSTHAAPRTIHASAGSVSHPARSRPTQLRPSTHLSNRDLLRSRHQLPPAEGLLASWPAGRGQRRRPSSPGALSGPPHRSRIGARACGAAGGRPSQPACLGFGAAADGAGRCCTVLAQHALGVMPMPDLGAHNHHHTHTLTQVVVDEGKESTAASGCLQLVLLLLLALLHLPLSLHVALHPSTLPAPLLLALLACCAGVCCTFP